MYWNIVHIFRKDHAWSRTAEMQIQDDSLTKQNLSQDLEFSVNRRYGCWIGILRATECKEITTVSSTCKLFSTCDSSIYHFFVKCWYDKLFKSPLGFNLTFFIISRRKHTYYHLNNTEYSIFYWRMTDAELFAWFTLQEIVV